MGKRKLVMATMNRHKMKEAEAILKHFGWNAAFELESLMDLGFSGDIPEEEPTLEGNASSKSRFVYQRYGCSCFSDDTGLEVEVLGGEPGVRSARFAGEDGDAGKNIALLLSRLHGVDNRKARFRTVISLILDGKEYFFEGEVRGDILTQAEGAEGFGYDPVFRPEGYSHSFAKMDAEEKNQISHRYEALRRMADFLTSGKAFPNEGRDKIGER